MFKDFLKPLVVMSLSLLLMAPDKTDMEPHVDIPQEETVVEIDLPEPTIFLETKEKVMSSMFVS